MDKPIILLLQIHDSDSFKVYISQRKRVTNRNTLRTHTKYL